jgi:amino-acid N-acetyltransferase
MSVEAATIADLPGIRRLLMLAGLPGDDLTERALKHFLVLRDDGALSGAIGLETYDDVALLRSLVVADEARGRGHGATLAAAAEALAEKLGITSVYLLTTSADKFFLARGYRVVPRHEAPMSIQATAQFSALCPSTAIVMVKS